MNSPKSSCTDMMSTRSTTIVRTALYANLGIDVLMF